MGELKKFRGKEYLCGDREFDFISVDNCIRVNTKVGDVAKWKWWTPAKPYPVGFDKETVLFDSIDSAVAALSMQYGIERFFDMNENDQIMDAQTPAECAKLLAKQLGSSKPKRKHK